MPDIGSIEKKIERVEGFQVNVLYPDGSNIRSDQQEFRHNYNYERAANGDMTVAQWRDVRFRKVFPGFRVKVLYGNGQVANGNAKLDNVRGTYSN